MTQQSPPSTQDYFRTVQFPLNLTKTSQSMCVYVHACVVVRTRLRVWFAGFSLISSTCARLNCFLYVIDLHLLGTPLSLSCSLFVSPSPSCPPLCTR